jgi:hypothetical protein
LKPWLNSSKNTYRNTGVSKIIYEFSISYIKTDHHWGQLPKPSRPQLPWVQLNASPSNFYNRACIPEDIALGKLSSMGFEGIKSWYKHLLDVQKRREKFEEPQLLFRPQEHLAILLKEGTRFDSVLLFSIHWIWSGR